MRSFFELVLSVVLLGACGMPAQEAPLLTPTITPNAAPNATPTAVPEPTPSPTITPTPTSQQADQPPLRGMKLTPAFPGLDLDRMVHMAEPDDGTSRLFVVLQPGEIIVFERNDGPQSAATFLDIRSRVNDSGNEEGLLSMAFDPAFAENGYFYVYYTSDEGGRHSVVSRFEISADDPDKADPSSETIILEVDQPAANHNGGQIAFGPDGYLYIGLGDGGRAGDPWGNGQDLSTLLASILRIDVSALDETGSYAVPDGNPFVDTPGARPEIWAYGLRNPWRFSFDRQTSDMWAGDVGQNRAEEIDIIQPGLNYGWNVMEGFECYQPSRNCDEQGLTMPVTEYGRSSGCSVTGGFVYRGEREPSLHGAYLYADYCSGNVWGLRHDGEGITEQRLLVDGGPNISSFAEDLSGEVYLLSFDGSIYVLESE